MTAVYEKVRQQRYGAARAEETPVGLVRLKSDRRVPCLGLDETLGTATRLHKGLENSKKEPPSAVISCPSGEEDLVPEVRSVRAPNSVVLGFVSSSNLRLAGAALGAGANGLLHGGVGLE